jgi:hypothetical protein
MTQPIARFLTLLMLGAASIAAAQGTAAIKVGIFPFTDATASGNHTGGTDVGRTLASEITHSTTMIPRLLGADESGRASDVDAEKAVAIGREQNVDLVFIGTVLEAKSEDASKRAWIPSIKGQSGNIDIRRVKATVVLQGDLYDVASGVRLWSERVTGTESNNKFGGTAYTRFGSWGNDSYASFLDSPMGKALQAALANMTKKVAATRPRG